MPPVDVHTRVDGSDSAPCVVFAGSLGSTSEMWDPQVDAFTDRYRVIRYDTRGHGKSPVPTGPYSIDDLTGDLVALLDRLGLTSIHLVGLSLGGMTAMRAAAVHPRRIRSLTVMCTSAALGPEAGWAARAATVRNEGTRAVAEAVVNRWFTPSFAAARPDVVATMTAMIAETPPEGYAACCDAVAAMDLRDDLASITAPTLVIAGADDPATPPEHLRAIADAVGGARYVEVASAAHLASWEQAATINAELRRHLDQCEDTR